MRRNASDLGFEALVEELHDRSPPFARLWARHGVAGDQEDPVTLRHPVVGTLRVHLERFDLPGGTGLSLFVGHPADEDTRAGLRRLAASGPLEEGS